jgi:acetyltransferase-like isoleucine patch superfamily enzyme
MTQDNASVRQALLKHGLDMQGHFKHSLIWESPARVHASVHLENVELGAYSYVAPYSELTLVNVGRYCSIGPYARLFGSRHPTHWLSSHPFAHKNIFEAFVDYEPSLTFEGGGKVTTIGHDVWLGASVTILPGTRIGDGAVIGAGAIVTKDVPAYAVVAGNPGRIVKYRFDEALIERMQRVRWWRFDLPRLLADQPDLPLDRPEAMLDFIEDRGADLPLIDRSLKQLFKGPDGLAVRTFATRTNGEDLALEKA